MKLIRKSEASRDLVEVRIASLTERAINKLLPGAVKASGPKSEFLGRVIWGRCLIQYDVLLPGGDHPMGVCHKRDVVFGTDLYQGVTPIKHLGECVYECEVDCVTQVHIGTIYQGE